MNPFEWRGPDFLLFYAGLAFLLLLWQSYRKRQIQTQAPGLPTARLTDPYEVAFLRGGKNAVLQVATVQMVQTGALKADGAELHRVGGGRKSHPNPIEEFLADFFKRPEKAHKVLREKLSPQAQNQLNRYEADLRKAGLLWNPALTQAKIRDGLLVIAVLLTIGLAKIAVALQNGHRNIWFLVTLMVAAMVVASVVMIGGGRMTSRGRETISDLQGLCAGMRSRSTGLSSAELALGAAVFGLAVLPAMGAPFAERLYPRAANASSSDGSSCGSSGCGSDSGSSSSSCGSGGGDSGGGSSCGGGGGCGGCGGGGGD